jgi:hypothetical protein
VAVLIPELLAAGEGAGLAAGAAEGGAAAEGGGMLSKLGGMFGGKKKGVPDRSGGEGESRFGSFGSGVQEPQLTTSIGGTNYSSDRLNNFAG